MSLENVDLVRRGWEAYERGDLSAVLADVSADVVTYIAPPSPVEGTYHGPEGLLQSLLDWAEGFDELVITAEEFIDAGDRVVVRTHQRARGAESGVPVEDDFWFVHTIRTGKSVRLALFVDRSAAFGAAGLSESDS